MREVLAFSFEASLMNAQMQQTYINPPAGGLGGDSRRADGHCRRLRNEFQKHARAGLEVWSLRRPGVIFLVCVGPYWRFKRLEWL